MSERDEIRRLSIAIRKKCVDCCGGMISEVRGCRIRSCPLWEFRTANGEKKPAQKCRGQMNLFELGVRSL